MTTDDVVLAAAVAGIDIQPATVRVWAWRGHIVRDGAGYDRQSVLIWLSEVRRASMVRACRN